MPTPQRPSRPSTPKQNGRPRPAGPGGCYRDFSQNSRFRADDPLGHGGAAGRAAYSFGPDASSDSFSTIDFSRINEKRSQCSKVDTFQTPMGPPDLETVQSAVLDYNQDPESLDPVHPSTVLALFSDLRHELVKALRKEFAQVRHFMDDRMKPVSDAVVFTSHRLQSLEKTLENLRLLCLPSFDTIEVTASTVKQAEEDIGVLRSGMPAMQDEMKTVLACMKDLNSMFRTIVTETLEPTASVVKNVEGDLQLLRSDVPAVKADVQGLAASVKEIHSGMKEALEPTASLVKSMEGGVQLLCTEVPATSACVRRIEEDMKLLCTDVPATKTGVSSLSASMKELNTLFDSVVKQTLEPTSACVQAIREDVRTIRSEVPAVQVDVKSVSASLQGLKAAQDHNFCSLADAVKFTASSLHDFGDALRSVKAKSTGLEDTARATAASISAIDDLLRAEVLTELTTARCSNNGIGSVLNTLSVQLQNLSPALDSVEAKVGIVGHTVEAVSAFQNHMDVVLSRVRALLDGASEEEEWSKWRHLEAERIRSAQERTASEVAAKRLARKNLRREQAQQALSALACPDRERYTIKIDEGDDIVARCSDCNGPHTLKLKTLTDLVAKQGYSKDSFQKFMADEKIKWTGEDVSNLVMAYMESNMPADPQCDEEVEAVRKKAEEARHEEHNTRLRAQELRMQAMKCLQDDLEKLVEMRQPEGPRFSPESTACAQASR